jgi:VIT1/CCC1 family predicted Fe2+/Mn2+ transporter
MKITDNSILGLIYTLILAAIITLFIGITLNTFYQAPKYPNEPVYEYKEGREPTKEEIEQEQQISEEHQKKMEKWSETSSVIIVVSATFLVALGLFLAGRLPILPNGILLGGFFTLFYGTILGFQSQNRYLIFGVTTAALLVVVLAGYLKFVDNPLIKKDKR